jgi:autotransporter-associated beta strand protein
LVIQSGGTVNVQNEVYVGNENNTNSVGTYTISGSASLNVGNQVIVGRDNGTGTVNLNGGTITTKWVEGGSGSATVNFNGGVLKARENQGSFIRDLDVANVQSGGIKIDSAGFNVATSQALTGTGGLEKSGAGSLTLSGASTYSGATTIAAGTLELNNTGGQALGATTSVSVTGATLLVSASNQLNNDAAVTLSGGTIRRGSGVSEVFGDLNLAGASSLDFGSGSSGFLQFDTYTRETESALLTVQNFFQGNSLIFSQNLVSAGYLDASSSGGYNNGYFAFSDGFTTSWNGTDTFTITAIPEPSTILAAGALALLLAGSRIRFRRHKIVLE